MTQVFLDTLSTLGIRHRLIDRRFSKTLGSVGRFQVSKILALGGLAVRLLTALLTERPSRAVFFMTNRTASFLSDVLLSEILRLFRVPVVGYIHTQGFDALANRGELWKKLVRRLLGSADLLVCLSPTLEEDVRRFAPRARLISIGNTPFEKQTGAPHTGEEPTTVLFLSNFIAEKGIQEFLELAHKFEDAGSSVRFVAAGAPTDGAQLATLRASASSNTHIVGPVHGDQKWRLLNEASVLAFPSRYPFEAQPLVIVEAMSVGLPVVAYEIGGIGDLIVDGETGFLLAQGDSSGFHTALVSVIDSPDATAAMRPLARNRFDKLHSRTSYEKAWHDIFSD